MKTKNKINALIIAAILAMTPSSLFAEEITVTVKGMVCSFCAQGIKKAFGSKEEVDNINVDLDNKLVAITTKNAGSLNDETVTQIVNDAGYDVVKIERK